MRRVFPVAWLVASALAVPGPTMAQDTAHAADGTIIGFAPPLDRNFIIEQGDTRTLPDGSQVHFIERLRLRFIRGEGGLLASLTRIAVDCAGPDQPCAAFRRVMTAGIGTVRRFALAPDASVSLLAGDIAIEPLATPRGDPAAIARNSEASQPGQVSTAELRAVLKFADRVLPARATAPGAAELEVRSVDAGIVTIVEREDLPAGSQTVPREVTSRVDSATGLVLSSVARVWTGTDRAVLVSDRHWQLTPE